MTIDQVNECVLRMSIKERRQRMEGGDDSAQTGCDSEVVEEERTSAGVGGGGLMIYNSTAASVLGGK